MEGNQLYSKSNLNDNLIQKNTCTEASRRVFDQISGYCGLAKLTHKISYYTFQPTKNLSAVHETLVRSQDREDPLAKGMATHFSILAWRIAWTEDTVQGGHKEWDTTE